MSVEIVRTFATTCEKMHKTNMKHQIFIQQLRSTIFLPSSMMYTPDGAKEYRNLLMPESQIFGIIPSDVLVLNVNIPPQQGLPWRLYKKIDEGNEINIVFHQGKIDVILSISVPYGNDDECKFCQKSAEFFEKILNKQNGINVSRIAYAPSYALLVNAQDENKRIEVWNSFLKNLGYKGLQMQDIRLSFLLKDIVRFGDKSVHMNILHNIFDAIQSRIENGETSSQKVLMFQLDLNTVLDRPINFDANHVKIFFNDILDIKNDAIDNVIK